jgi:hypothetical protein
LKTSPKRPDVPFTSLPPMKWPISRMRLLPGDETAPGPLGFDYLAAFFRSGHPPAPRAFRIATPSNR